MDIWTIIIIVCGIIGLLIIGLIFFYRYPNYHEQMMNLSHDIDDVIKLDNSILYSPAHGVVSDIRINENTGETLVSIFLNVYDIHHQYSPCTGIIEKMEYHDGSFNPAGFFEKSRDNERMKIYIKREGVDGDKITVTQIAGIIARVIETNVKEGQIIKQGGYIGMIKLGSRVDITYPTSKFITQVKEGDRVNGLNSIIAYAK